MTECLSPFNPFMPCILIIQAKWSPLHTLALSGQVPFMDRLLETGLHIDTVDQVRIVQILLRHFCPQVDSISGHRNVK